MRARASSIWSTVKRWWTEQWPCQRMMRERSRSSSRHAAERAERLAVVPERHLVERDAHLHAGVAAQVLVREEERRFFCANAHSSTFGALLDVQTAPPCSPTNALSAAAEFMYVIGTISSAMPAARRARPSTRRRLRDRPCRPSSSRPPCSAGRPSGAARSGCRRPPP